MDKVLKRKWVKALRSRKFKQERGHLGLGNKLCCLGVLSVVATGRPQCLQWRELIDQDPRALIDLNDGKKIKGKFVGGKPFSKIADYIEKHL
jgi:hypothetical protein